MTDTQGRDGVTGNETNGLELFLLTLRYKEGRLLSLEGNTPFLLDDPAVGWVVYAGKADVFAVRMRDGEVVAPRRHLLRAEAGDVLLGLEQDADGHGVALLASGVPGTRVLKLTLSRLRELAAEIEYRDIISTMLDRWIIGFSQAVAREIPPKDPTVLYHEQTTTLKAHEAAMPKDGVLWIKHLAGNSRFTGREDVPLMDGDDFVPLSPFTWLRSTAAGSVTAINTATLIERDPEWTSLTAFHRLVLRAITRNRAWEETAERERIQKKTDAQRLVVENAFGQIAALLEPAAATPLTRLDGNVMNPLVAACQLVGAALAIEIRQPADGGVGHSHHNAIRRIAKASNIRMRQVALNGDWWHDDNGPLLASIEANEQPVALLPTSPRSYALHNPAARTSTPVTPSVAATLAPVGFTFYRPFPQRALTIWDLLKFGVRGSQRDLVMVLFMGMAAGLLGLVGPIVTGIVFDRVIPQSQRSQLLVIGLVLLVIAVALALFQMTRSIAMLRVEGKADAAVQAAVWDRLLSLPVPFFRNYSTGDLGVRAMGINTIRQALSGPVITSVLSGVFSVFNFVLLFLYDARLAVVATGLVLLAVVVTTLAGYLQVRQQRALAAIEGRISGTVLQFINGIAKFRVAGAQHRAFATWANQFTQQRRLAYRARTVGNGLAVFNAAYPIITSFAIFATLAAAQQRGLSTGQFLAFSAAFAQLLFAALQLSAALISILRVIPIYERAKPILETLPEADQGKADPGELRGEIEINHVSFRYKDNGPLVLKDVSLHIKPGEFVALVGPSGSGKSTFLRLLLGFDSPESGAIYYDGQDLTGLDMGSVRQQIGVVLQNGKIMSGLLLQNIIGSSLLTVDDAWDAARMAGLEEDIRHMPMGMFTMVSEGGGTFSGGQRQRLMIARAIANKPRIVFFDEATSALDNRTQETVSHSLEGLHATRVVIAHRLSTISNAHRIYVLDGGRIVQTGTYSELIAQPGLFADLAKRQTA